MQSSSTLAVFLECAVELGAVMSNTHNLIQIENSPFRFILFVISCQRYTIICKGCFQSVHDRKIASY